MPIKDNTGPTPITDPMTCEICGTSVPLANTHSIAIDYRMPGLGVQTYQCKNEQHFADTHEHAVLAAIACLLSHIESGPHIGTIGTDYTDVDLQALNKAFKKYHK